MTGEKGARLRHEGLLPAVIYRRASEPSRFERDDLRRHAGGVHPGRRRRGQPEGQAGAVHQPCRSTRSARRPLHVDLFAVRIIEELTVEVGLVGVGAAPAVESGGRTLVHPTSIVRVRALPDKLPESLHYDLSSLVDYDSTITVAPVSEARKA